MKIAIYTRLSPNPDKEDTVNQERDLVEYAGRMGWEIVNRYSDIHVSGSKKGEHRLGFTSMMEDASKKKFDLLLFWSLDRLSREGVPETLAYLQRLNSYGVDYKSYTEQYFDSCGIFKDVVIAIMATIAKQERVRLIERTKAGLKTAVAKGKRLGRPSATRVTPNRLIALDVELAKKMRINGKTLKEIAERFQCNEATISRLMKREGLTK